MKRSSIIKFVIPVLIITIIFALWLLSGVWIYNTFDAENRGSIGDMFGAVNALFSGFALFGIIFTIYMQRKELGLQRIELADTRSEFQINRVTNVIYNQLKRIEEKLESNPFINPFQKSIPRTNLGYSFINDLYTEIINKLTNIKSIEISNKKELRSTFFKNIETDLIKLIKVLDQYLTASILTTSK